ncbi:methyl-accepting chemotaxis protein [Marinobacter daepoensis]|uniref:Methyl-accepting chemotaxis protein n=1 Tax=Marinobacter daepoensis TaxID=262077 RepID=A0ABS3BMV3_9GAMM|nr:methyl-accepting chemotaxis protein [Marinobacter daepoensis]MBN7771515.1 methyl-accepting chemotaxis protein [Marinobacter daepoensis]MBY6034215.1 methyl-accepting chemotaxis protein [Marinobacter daepoensis]MBY6080115.1 methyl-accepting chemotaxis protein [Marinobacter daepoensis]
MNSLSNLSLKFRLVTLVSIPLLAIAGLSLYALLVFSDINRGVSSIYSDRVVPLKDLKIISDDYAVLVVDTINKANAGRMTPEEALRQIEIAESEIRANWVEYTQTLLTAREQQLVRETERLLSEANKGIAEAKKILRNAPSNAQGQLDQIDGPLYDVIDPVTEKIGELIHLQLEVAASERESVGEIYSKSLMLYPTTAVVAAVLSIGASVLIILSITGPIQSMKTLMGAVAEQSDLSRRIDVKGKDELAQLGHSLNHMLTEFDQVISRLSLVSDEVATASEELSSINASVERNIESQSGQTDQVATAMNQMSAASNDVARSAEEAQSAARSAKEQGIEGRVRGEKGREALHRLSEDIRRVASQINSLESKSLEIQKVTQVINEIADQTNLLALNAAIEAARAGEHGRGFSVVADEVRSLAKRTQTSTAEIADVIQGLTEESKATVAVMQSGLEQVEENRMLIDDVAETLNAIGDAIDHIVQMGEQIASAAEEQSVAAEQVSGNLTHIVDLSSQNLDGAKQSSEASHELARLAAEMKDRVSSFRTSS